MTSRKTRFTNRHSGDDVEWQSRTKRRYYVSHNDNMTVYAFCAALSARYVGAKRITTIENEGEQR